MINFKLKNSLKKMKHLACSIKRGNSALHDFMCEACDILFQHRKSIKIVMQIDDDIEKGIIEYFFPKKPDEKSCEKQRRNMYIRALKKLSKEKDLTEVKRLLDEKGVYELSRNNSVESVGGNRSPKQGDGKYNDEQEDLQDMQPLTKKRFKTHLKQKNAFKKSVIILKVSEGNGYVAIVNKSIHEKICELMEDTHVKQIQLFDES